MIYFMILVFYVTSFLKIVKNLSVYPRQGSDTAICEYNVLKKINESIRQLHHHFSTKIEVFLFFAMI